MVLAVIAAVIIISALTVVRFVDDALTSMPLGVGPIGSEHVHAKFAVMLNGTWVDTHLDGNPYFVNANEYIFLERPNFNIIHRHATGATLGMFLEGLGMTFTDGCLIIIGDVLTSYEKSFEKKEYCEEGNYKLKLYVNQQLNKENGEYVILEGDNIFIVWDNVNEPTRSYG